MLLVNKFSIIVVFMLAFLSHGIASENSLADEDLSEDALSVVSDSDNGDRVVRVPSSGLSTVSPDFEYKIGYLDLLEVEVFRAEELNRSVRVNLKGEISLPLIGIAKVGGLSVSDAEAMLAERLQAEYMQNPHVSIFIREYESQKITVNGWVKNPGVFPLKGRTTLMQIISMADGLERLADATEVVIFRKEAGKGTTGYKVNFEDVQSGRVSDPVLLRDDIVVVPQNGSKAAFEETTKTLRTFLGFIPFF